MSVFATFICFVPHQSPKTAKRTSAELRMAVLTLCTTDQAHTTTSATRPQDHKWKPKYGGLSHHLATLCWPPWPQSGGTETMGASIEWRCDGSGLLTEAFRLGDFSLFYTVEARFHRVCPRKQTRFVTGTIPGTKGGTESLCEKSLCAFFARYV